MAHDGSFHARDFGRRLACFSGDADKSDVRSQSIWRVHVDDPRKQYVSFCHNSARRKNADGS
jgi:hypothetical protein